MQYPVYFQGKQITQFSPLDDGDLYHWIIEYLPYKKYPTRSDYTCHLEKGMIIITLRMAGEGG